MPPKRSKAGSKSRSAAVSAARDENLAASRRAFYHRACLNGAASVGKYTDEMEAASPSGEDPPHRRGRLIRATIPACRRYAQLNDRGSEEAMMGNALSDKERALMDAYWRAPNYPSVRPI